MNTTTSETAAAAHTPGPWTTRPFDESQTAILPPLADSDRQGLICVVSIGEGRPDGDANARLIAAAPELLEALRRCERQIDECQRLLSEQGKAMAASHLDLSLLPARAAIAKATKGGAS